MQIPQLKTQHLTIFHISFYVYIVNIAFLGVSFVNAYMAECAVVNLGGVLEAMMDTDLRQGKLSYKEITGRLGCSSHNLKLNTYWWIQGCRFSSSTTLPLSPSQRVSL